MNDLVQTIAWKYIFNPPTRPLPQSYQSGSDNDVKLTCSTTGDEIHVKLIAPYSMKQSTMKNHIKTSQIIILCHGNSDDVQSCTSYGQWLADELKCHVLVYDPPAYGYSSGSCNTTEENMFASVCTSVNFIIEKLSYEMAQIIVIGKSLGSVPAIHICANRKYQKIGGLVLISPLASGARCIISASTLERLKKWSPSCLSQLDKLFAPNLFFISSVSCPVCIIHGLDDKIVPIENSYALVQNCLQCKQFAPMLVDAGHNDIEARFLNQFVEKLRLFNLHCLSKTNESPNLIDIDDDMESCYKTEK